MGSIKDQTPETKMQLMSTTMSAVSAFVRSRFQRDASDFTTKQLERNAKARFALGTRQAYEEQRQGRIMMSNARAAMGASGGTTTDAGAINQLADIKQTSDYNAMSAIFGAKSESQGIFEKAQAVRYEGEQKSLLTKTRGISSVLSDAAKIRKNWK
ncbi:MAG: hypothetical protein ABW134_11795 [Candidatus Thiodiazotropha endolucinida]